MSSSGEEIQSSPWSFHKPEQGDDDDEKPNTQLTPELESEDAQSSQLDLVPPIVSRVCSPPLVRPNKYHGPASTWREWTEPERQIHASLLHQRATDLSLHLYRAHMLKARLRDPARAISGPSWSTKESWIAGSEQGSLGKKYRHSKRGVQNEEDRFYPPSLWTAWPMPPDVVPREGEKVGWDPDSDKDGYTWKKEEQHWPSSSLEEVLTARILKKAKERFEGREQEDDPLGGVNSGDGDGHDFPPSRTKPVVMTDEEEAHRLIRPSVRHLLSKLDDLLMCLHRARQSYSNSVEDSTRRKRAKTQSSVSRELQVSTTAASSQKRRGRPRKYSYVVSPTAVEELKPETNGPELALSMGKRPRGRPVKYRKPMEGESYYLMRRRMLEAQNTQRSSHDAVTTPTARDSSSSRDDSVGSTSSSSSADILSSSSDDDVRGAKEKLRQRKRCRARLGLRDWSDVIGVASMIGFDQASISRTADRCADLFGEGIRFRTLREEDAFSKEECVTEYVPESLLHTNSVSGEDHSTSSDQGDLATSVSTDDTTGNDVAPPVYASQKLRTTTLPTGEQNFLCSYPDCKRYSAPGFSRPTHLRRHFKLVHGIEISTNSIKAETATESESLRTAKKKTDSCSGLLRGALAPDSDEEMIGGLHVDGFLRPIPPLKRSRTRCRT